jgi:ABC-2 type transport system ATP-binding protein
MCDRIAFLRRGKIVAEGTPSEIARRAPSGSLEDVFIAIAREPVGPPPPSESA